MNTATHKMIRKLLPPAAVITLLIALVAAFWAPTLLGHKTLIHGDSLLHSLPLWQYYEANLNTWENLLWDKFTYGGHPLFAEGQGGFAFPLHILLARIVSPVFANTFAHCIEMVLAAVAVIGLGRLLKLSYWACGFAGIATIFSSYWIQMQQNMTISAAAMTIPWILWAGEYWIQRLSCLSAALLGIATAMGVLAGYPQCVHGAIIYLITAFLANLFAKQPRDELLKCFPLLLKTGGLAVFIAIGLAAIQLLPLLELTEYSHRAAGTVDIWFKLPLSSYIRGLFYALQLHDLDPPNFFQVMGSLLTCILFTLSIFFKASVRIAGHAIAAILLLNLGVGGASPLTQIIYDYHLLPGMHYFRQTAPYFLVANIGISLVAAAVIDNIARNLQIKSSLTFAAAVAFIREHKAKLAIFIALWLSAFSIAGLDQPVCYKHIVIVLTTLLGTAMLSKLGQAAKIPMLILFLLSIEVATTKIHEFHFGSTKLLEKPASVAMIEADPTRRDYKIYSASGAFMYAMGSPHQSGIDVSAKRMLAQMCGLSNLIWRAPSLMGALALPLRERMLLAPVFEQEVNAKSSTPPGMRLIDLLGVKYIAADAPLSSPTFKAMLQDPATSAWLIENSAAKPRFQTYANYVFVNSSEEALQILRAANAPILTLEIPAYADRKLAAAMTPPAPTSTIHANIQFTLIDDEPTRYRLNVHADDPGWLFLADANYPGWRAYIDGRETPVYTAQILGKAIYIPTGDHDVIISFKSMSFQLGLRITLATLLAIATAGIITAFRTRSQRQKLLPTN